MSATQFDWPASDTLAAARQVRYLGWTCRTDHAVGGAESDPKPSFSQVEEASRKARDHRKVARYAGRPRDSHTSARVQRRQTDHPSTAVAPVINALAGSTSDSACRYAPPFAAGSTRSAGIGNKPAFPV